MDLPPIYNGGTINPETQTPFTGGSSYSRGGVELPPSVTVDAGDGSTTFKFSDGPGVAVNPSDVDGSYTSASTYTTYVMQKSTGNILAQQTWSTSATLNSNGTGSSTFHYGGP